MDPLATHPHAHLLGEVERPGRYAGPEWGCASAPDDADVSFALAFPDVYEVGSSNIGLGVLYRTLAALPRVRVERVFAPWPDYGDALAASGLALVSRESATPIAEFDVVGFSLQYELTFTTVLWMLELAGVPVRSRDRGDRAPLVVAGGPAASNPGPMSPFVDAFVAGDGEHAVAGIVDAVRTGRASGRGAVLDALAASGRIHVPGRAARGAPVPRARFAPPATLRAPAARPVVPAVEAVFDRVQVEIARGCAAGCRFCHAGVYYRPPRQRSPGRVIETAVRDVIETGWDEVSLSALSSADHPAIGRVVSALGELLAHEHVAIAVPSLRAYGLDDDVLETIRAVKATGMTLAPEAGSDRMRDVLNKNVTDRDLVEALGRLRRRGWQKVKLYFMTGLPGETGEDLEALADLVWRAARLWGSRRGGRRRISVSVSNFVPKPHTVFEREALLAPGELAGRASRIRELLARCPVRLSTHDPEQSFVEGLLARGGPEMGAVLEAVRRAGARLEGWSEHFDAARWWSGLESEGLDPVRIAAPLPADGPLPWHVFEGPVDAAFLDEERERAALARGLAPCDGPVAERCHACGADCDPGEAAFAGGDDTHDGIERARALIDRHGRAAEGVWDEPEPGVRHWVGVGFDRIGPAAWLGHRDVIRQMVLVMRRAALPLRYTSGYTPRPRLVFRAALPLGVVGIHEEVRIEVLGPLARPDALVRSLAAVAPRGLVFRRARALTRAEADDIARGPARIRWYCITDGVTGMDACARAADWLAGTGHIPITRTGRRGTREIEGRDLVAGCRVEPIGDIDDLARAGADPATPVVVVDAVASEGRWMRVREIVDLVAGRGVRVAWTARRLVAGGEP